MTLGHLPRHGAAPYDEAVRVVAVRAGSGLRFHDLRHSYTTWLVDDGVPPDMVQRVMGHENVTTTLQRYTRRTEHHGRILDALGDGDDDDGPDDPGRRRRGLPSRWGEGRSSRTVPDERSRQRRNP